MNLRRGGVHAALVLLFCLAAALPVRGREGENGVKRDNVISVTGVVRLVGNDPFYELVISGQDAEWYIERAEMDKLEALQNRTVTLRGTETVTALRFANGRYAGERRSLKDIEIIKVE